MQDKIHVTKEEALQFHQEGQPGKISLVATKPLMTQRDLSLAYSPGVAYPCLEIAKDPLKAYDYTAKGNMVAVISNGTAVLGLGNLGALASKPVMEGKAVLLKKFADIDSIDLEVNTENVDEFINCVRYLGASFGGINLEDIKAPDCFIIEEELRKHLNIPVFHDDQHGTAIIVGAAFINSLKLTSRDILKTRVVINGAGAAAIACADLLSSMGLPPKNIIMADRQGVIYQGRLESMNPWKEKYANSTKFRTLKEALIDADVFIGLSSKGAVTSEMVKTMAPEPIIFAMANPDPEIMPEEVRAVRKDAIIATGRSDYPNQVNNVLCFPYIFRGALDVHATVINEEMKIAAAKALADLAHEVVPDEVRAAYGGRDLHFSKDYIIPVPFDPRLIYKIPSAVAWAAMETGVALKRIEDRQKYQKELRQRLDPLSATLHFLFEEVRAFPKTVVFAEGEDPKAIRAAISYVENGYGRAILIGREDIISEVFKKQRLLKPEGVAIHNAQLSARRSDYTDFLYKRLQRHGALYRDCQRFVNHDRNIFAACMLAHHEADTLVTGLTRNYSTAFTNIKKVIDAKENECVFGLSLTIRKGQILFIADTLVNTLPSPEILADIAIQSAAKARALGKEPRVAFISHASFGEDALDNKTIQEAISLLEKRQVTFEFDGEMTIEVALNSEARALYPFCRLSKSANILIMPSLEAAHISTQLLQVMEETTTVGPLLIGLEKPVQITQMGATVSDLVTLAAFGAHEAGHNF